MTTAQVMKCKSNLLDGFHTHHVIPRYLGGSDNAENLICLHPYDHAIAHFVRWKIYKTSGDAWAFNKLKRWLDSGGMTVKGMQHSDASRIKIGIASSVRKRKPHSEETKIKISKTKKGCESNRKGKKLSFETIQKMRIAHSGQIPWCTGTVGVVKAWNKGLVGKQTSWNKGLVGKTKWSEEAKKIHSEKIKSVWEKRKKGVICQQQVL